MFYDDDADLGLLDGKTVAIIGYGSQGHAHALNLQESGVSVVVGLRPDSKSVEQARGHGLEVLDPGDAASRGDIVMMLVPDELHRQIWEEDVRDGVASGNTLMLMKLNAPVRTSVRYIASLISRWILVSVVWSYQASPCQPWKSRLVGRDFQPLASVSS